MEAVKESLAIAEEYYKKSCYSSMILIYHRVTELDLDPHLLAVSPRNFEDHLRYLQENFAVISLKELVRCLQKGYVPPKSIVITFDDGYADNLYNAKPLLEKYGVPATVFVTAGIFGSPRREFWWDELEQIFFVDKPIFSKPLTVNYCGCEYTWNIDSLEKAKESYSVLHSILKTLTHEERLTTIDSLFKWAGIKPVIRDSHRPLSCAELQQLDAGGLVEIGAHTLNHVLLSAESPTKQEDEISLSKLVLQNILGKSVMSFSYPFGGGGDVTKDTPTFVKQAGFSCGIANVDGNVFPNTDLYWLPRRLVRNWDIRKFISFIETNMQINQYKLFSLAKQQFCDTLIEQTSRDTKTLNSLDFTSKAPTGVKEKSNFSILQINENDSMGGTGKIVYSLHTGHRDCGYQTKMLVNRMATSDKDIAYVPSTEGSTQSLLSFIQEEIGLPDLFQISPFLIKNTKFFQESNIIHLHNLHSSYFSYLALPELVRLKPTVWTLHDIQALTGHCAHSINCNKWIDGCSACPDLNVYVKLKIDTASLLWKMKKALYNKCDPLTIVCPSEWLRKKAQQGILGTKRVELIYNGIDEALYRDHDKNFARQTLQLPTEKLLILFLAEAGVDNFWKGGNFFVRLFEHFQHRDDLLFINAGGNRKIALDKNWLDIGFISDPAKLALLYSAADLLVYPSLSDNCPLVVLEALACATPVLSFQTGGIPELVKHLETGYIADYGNLEDLIRGFEIFINNPDFRRKASWEARQSVLRRFTRDRMIKEYQKLYEEIVKPLERNKTLPVEQANSLIELCSPVVQERDEKDPVEKLTTLIFSKDRAMQLDGLLSSLHLHCQDSQFLHPKVLFACSSEHHEAQYRELVSLYPQVEFIAETDFTAQVVAILHSSDKILLLVDDALFVRRFSVQQLSKLLDARPEAVGVSLRLGKNTVYCYPLQISQRIPRLENVENNFLCYDWSNAEGDFGYPMEVSSSFYRTTDVLQLLYGSSFNNPNELEGALAASVRKALPPEKKLLLCPEQSLAFSCPVNVVQTCCTNRYETSQECSAEYLSELFAQGRRIAVDTYRDFVPVACHQPVKLRFR